MTKPCVVCGGARDNGTSQCRSCRAEAMRRYRSTPEGKDATRRMEANRKNPEERKVVGNALRAAYMKTPQGKEVSSKASKRYRAKHREAIRAKERERRASDPLFRLRANLRRRLREILKKNGSVKSQSAIDLLGCSIGDFMNHIASAFKDGMTWDNYGEWELYHIHPISLANTDDDIRRLFHYTNIQPLWSVDNKRKQNKILFSSDSVATGGRINATNLK